MRRYRCTYRCEEYDGPWGSFVFECPDGNEPLIVGCDVASTRIATFEQSTGRKFKLGRAHVKIVGVPL